MFQPRYNRDSGSFQKNRVCLTRGDTDVRSFGIHEFDSDFKSNSLLDKNLIPLDKPEIHFMMDRYSDNNKKQQLDELDFEKRSIMSIEDQFASYKLQKLSEQSNFLFDRSSRNSKGIFWGFNRNSQQKNSDQSILKNNENLMDSQEMAQFEQHGAIMGGSNRSSFDRNPRFCIQNPIENSEKDQSNKDQSLELVLEWNDPTQINPDELQEMINKMSLTNKGKDDIYIQKPDRLSLIPQQKQQGCICKKTKCLKLYCQCFRSNKMCTSQCECQECFNNDEHSDKLQQVRQQILEKNPQAFLIAEEKVEQQEQDNKTKKIKISCHCKKSKCKMKYCECFNLGLKCSKLCNCVQCENCLIKKDELLHQQEDKDYLNKLMEEEIGEEQHKKIKID